MIAVAAMTAAVAASVAASFSGGGASPACSGLVQAPDAFMHALGAY